MSCNRIDSALDNYLDGTLPKDAASRLTQHLERCLDCRGKLDGAQALKTKLAALPVEGPSEGFYGRAMDAARQAAPAPRDVAPGRRRFGIPSAIAAAVLVWFAGSFLFDSSTRSPLPAVPEVAIALAETQPINLVFSSSEALNGARVSLKLPQGIELAGYSGRRELTWTTNLKAGKNVLQLPIVAHALADAEIVAHLQHGSADKTFRVKVRVI